ncbi:MAG: rare lipoprotein A, partial [Arenicella sp.]
EVGYLERGKATYFADSQGARVTDSGKRYDMNILTASHPFLPFGTLVKVTNLNNGKSINVRINDRPQSNQQMAELTKAGAMALGMEGQFYTDVKMEVLESVKSTVKKVVKVEEEKEKPGETVKYVFVEKPVYIEKEGASTTNDGLVKNTGDTKSITLEEKFKPVNTYLPTGELAKPKGFAVQVGSYDKPENALEKAQMLERLHFQNIFIQSGWDKKGKSYRVLLGDFENEKDAQELANLLGEPMTKLFTRKHF